MRELEALRQKVCATIPPSSLRAPGAPAAAAAAAAPAAAPDVIAAHVESGVAMRRRGSSTKKVKFHVGDIVLYPIAEEPMVGVGEIMLVGGKCGRGNVRLRPYSFIRDATVAGEGLRAAKMALETHEFPRWLTLNLAPCAVKDAYLRDVKEYTLGPKVKLMRHKRALDVNAQHSFMKFVRGRFPTLSKK